MLPYQTEHKVFLQADSDGPKTKVITAINYRFADIEIRKVQTGTTRGLAGASFEVKIDEQSIGTFGPTDKSVNTGEKSLKKFQFSHFGVK